MRRIYESVALHRDDGDPFAPAEESARPTPEAMRTVPSETLSRLLLPSWLRYRGLSVDLTTPRAEYERGEGVPFTVDIRNTLPVPVTVETVSPRLWTWSLDGHDEASHVQPSTPAEPRTFTFTRGERKRFRRRWSGLFRVSDSEWEHPASGRYTLRASLNVSRAGERDLVAETSVTITE